MANSKKLFERRRGRTRLQIRRAGGERPRLSVFRSGKHIYAQIIDDFQNGEDLRYFVGNPKTGGYGLTLTKSHTVIYYSNSYDLEVRLQSEDRVHRIGQTSKVTYVDLVTEGTVDEKIVQSLRNKINIATQVMGEELKQWLI